MNEHELFKKAFSDLHASDHTLQEVMSRAHSRKGARGIPKRIAVLVSVVAVIFSMALVAHGSIYLLLGDFSATLTPAEDPEQVIDHAFGDKINTEKAVMYDSHGDLIEVRDMERPAIDLTEFKKLYGDYISDVNAVFTIEESTFTLKNFLIDETGIGAVIWTVENPNGIPYHYSGYGFVCFDWTEGLFTEPTIRHFGAEGQEKFFSCKFTALISENSDGTMLELVTYFGTFDQYEIGDHFVWEIAREPLKDVRTVQITPTCHIPAKKMTAADGTQLTVGSQGLVLDVNRDDEFFTNKIILHFSDGTQYCLEDWDKMIRNSSGGLWREDIYEYDDLVILYNRLIDVDKVVSVEITEEIHQRNEEDTEFIYTYEDYMFYP